jgi:hypothetical protein
METVRTRQRPVRADAIQRAGAVIARELAAKYPGIGLSFSISESFEIVDLAPGESMAAVTIVARRAQ